MEPSPLNSDAASELETLRAEVCRLTALVTQLQEQLAAALAENAELRQGGQGGQGGAAPFSKGERKANPKRPGRKPGQGLFKRRTAPHDAEADVTDVEAALASPVCPDCGGELGQAEYEEASNTEAPEIPRPRVTRFRVEKRRCTCCRRLVRGTHPDLAPDQFGATAHRVSPSVYAWAHWVHYGLGLPVRKIPAFLQVLLGIQLTQSAITQDALRRVGAPVAPSEGAGESGDAAGPVGPIGRAYRELRRQIAHAPQLHTDDTSWRIGGDLAWLMVFCTVQLVVYQVRRRHRNEEVREILGQLFAGVLICDRGPSYEARSLRSVAQQKCLSHLIRNITDVLDFLPGEARELAERLRDLLREALALWWQEQRGEALDFEGQARGLCARADVLLVAESHPQPVLHRLLNGIGQQHDRGHLLRFLTDPSIEPTNNRGERMLRPAVIARKVSQCSRTDAGAEAHAAWSSLIGTLRGLCSQDLIGDLLICMQTGKLPGLPDLAAPVVPEVTAVAVG